MLINYNGKKYTYTYDQVGRLVGENNHVTGIETIYRYYPSGALKAMCNKNGDSIIDSFEYRYDRRGNQISKIENAAKKQNIIMIHWQGLKLFYNRMEEL